MHSQVTDAQPMTLNEHHLNSSADIHFHFAHILTKWHLTCTKAQALQPEQGKVNAILMMTAYIQLRKSREPIMITNSIKRRMMGLGGDPKSKRQIHDWAGSEHLQRWP